MVCGSLSPADASVQQLPALSTLAMDSSSSQSSSSCCPDHDHQHHHHHHKHHHKHHNSSSSSSQSASQQQLDAASQQQQDLDLERASQLVRFNAFGDAFEDLAAAAVRGAVMPHSHVGLWPAFSLFNHSCVPNTAHYVVGRNMVVRATEDVHAGERMWA